MIPEIGGDRRRDDYVATLAIHANYECCPMSPLLSPDGMDCLQLEDLIDGRYRVTQVLNVATWGKTYLAQDTRRPSQPYCLIQHAKPIQVIPDHEAAVRHLFVREAAILEQLADHDQIPQLLACFEDEQGFYLVQECISGAPLSLELHPQQPWPEEQVITLLIDCLEPLAFIHDQGVRHGNLQPDNLIRRMQDGKLMLVNFDSMHQLHLSLIAMHGQTDLPTPVNNQGYQPIEQTHGLPCFASDVYAIGMIAIQALTGVHPLLLPVDPVTSDVLWQQYCHVPKTSWYQGLLAILTRMVCRDVNQRYATAGEALAALQRLLQIPSLDENQLNRDLANRDLANREHSSLTIAAPVNIVPVTEPSELAISPLPVVQTLPQSMTAESAGSTLLVGVGVGAVLSAMVCGYVILVNPPDQIDRGPLVLDQATKKYQSGELPQAISLAESIPINSKAYKPARAAISRWQKHWEAGAADYQAIEDAFSQGKWLDVLKQSQKLPNIKYWQQQSVTLVQQALTNANADATQRLSTAYNFATEKNFTQAIAQLQQIPEGTTLYPQARQKIREYSEKLQIRSVVFLQRAYDRAIIGDFTGALTFLNDIPPDTIAYPKAQQKIREYTMKQKVQAESLLSKAIYRAERQDLVGAIAALGKIPPGTPVDTRVQEKTAEYTEKLYVLADRWLQQANEYARSNNLKRALALLEKIPLGTPAYATAREKIAEYTGKQQGFTNHSWTLRNGDRLNNSGES